MNRMVCEKYEKLNKIYKYDKIILKKEVGLWHRYL